jgi:hypothetical protein
MTDITQTGEGAPAVPASPVEVNSENIDQLFEQQRGAESAESTPEAKNEVKEEKREEPKVNLGALHEERMRRKAAEAKVREYNAELNQLRQWRQQNEAILQERLAALQQPKSYDPEKQPVEYLANEQKRTQELLAELNKRSEQQEQLMQAERAAMQFRNHVIAEEEKFAKDQPDYLKAIDYAKKFKASEYRALGYGDEEVAAALQQDIIGIATRALQLGESPAKLAWQYALAVGFKPSVSPEKKLNMMEAGQKATKPSSGGSQDTATLSLDVLASMSNEDFAKLSESDFRKVMGG